MPIGEWDVVLALPSHARVLKKGHLNGTDGKFATISGEFDLTDEMNMEKVEIRMFSYQNTKLQVGYLQVERVK